MSHNDVDVAKKFKVGLFTIMGLVLIGAITVFVNDRPYWYRPCQLVSINVEDATGLKTKSPIRSLGLQIGYLKSVELFETHVKLKICITAPVEVIANTRAYVRGEGFLGDKFVELKPVHYVGHPQKDSEDDGAKEAPLDTPVEVKPQSTSSRFLRLFDLATSLVMNSAWAQQGVKEIPVGKQGQDVQQLVNEVDSLVGELTDLTKYLKKAFDPKDLQVTMTRLNSTLENASRTLSPEGNLTTTAQRALAKLEDAIEQFRDQLTRVNQGKGSVGRVLNDPVYAEQLEMALRNINRLLGKAGDMHVYVDIGGEQIPAYNEGRGWFQVGIWPNRERYYLLGAALDPRGKITTTSTTTTVGGTSYTSTSTVTEDSGLLITAMLGRVFWSRLNMAIGISHGDGAIRLGVLLGPSELERIISVNTEVYLHSPGTGQTSLPDARAWATIHPSQSPYLSALYVRGGIESIRQINGKWGYTFGAGVAFDDDDIKFLFSFL